LTTVLLQEPPLTTGTPGFDVDLALEPNVKQTQLLLTVSGKSKVARKRNDKNIYIKSQVSDV